MKNLRLRSRGRRFLVGRGEKGGIMIQMSLDMRRIMMYVALCFYLQANLVHVLMLIDNSDCFGSSSLQGKDMVY